MCSTSEDHDIETEFNKSGHENKGFDKNGRKLNANPYTGGANLMRSSILENHPTKTYNGQDHKPSNVIATEILHMNSAADSVTLKLLSLPPFQHKDSVTHRTNPSLGPFRYKASGDTYKGQYFRGQRQGYGELITKTGEVYNGEWDFDQCNGIGRLLLPNGDNYEGEFLANRANGKGVFKSEETGIKYEGDFKDDMQEGKGKETYPDGSFYYGEFVGKSQYFNLYIYVLKLIRNTGSEILRLLMEVNTQVDSFRTIQQDRVNMSTLMVVFTKGSGSRTKSMVLVFTTQTAVQFIREVLLTVRGMVEERLLGKIYFLIDLN